MKATLVLKIQGDDLHVKRAGENLDRYRPLISQALAHINLELADEPEFTYEGKPE